MTEDEIKAEMNVYNKIIADNYAQYCETPKDNGRTDTLIKTIEELERTKKQLAIAVQSLSTITHYAPTCCRNDYRSIYSAYSYTI